MKYIKILFLFSLFSVKSKAQITPQKVINQVFIEANFNDSLFLNKQIDNLFKTQIQGALLFFPELKNVNIKFSVKKTLVPLAARPRIWAVFQKPEKRRYLITISSKSIGKLEPILLKNLNRTLSLFYYVFNLKR